MSPWSLSRALLDPQENVFPERSKRPGSFVSCSHGHLCLLPSVSPLFLRSFPLAFPHSLPAPIFSPPLRDNWSGENCYWGLHDPALSVLLPEQGEGDLSTEPRWPNGLSLPLPSLSFLSLPLPFLLPSVPLLLLLSSLPPSLLACWPPSIRKAGFPPTHAKSPVAVHHQVMVKANTHLHGLLAVSSSSPHGLSRTWAPPQMALSTVGSWGD